MLCLDCNCQGLPDMPKGIANAEPLELLPRPRHPRSLSITHIQVFLSWNSREFGPDVSPLEAVKPAGLAVTILAEIHMVEYCVF